MRASGSSGRWTPGGLSAAAVATMAAALAAAAWLATGGTATVRSLVESPETGIRRALAAPVGSEPRAVPGTRATVRFDRAKLGDLLVTSAGSRAEVVAVADADGAVSWRGQDVRLSYVGRERLTLVRCRGACWCVDGELLPNLTAVLSVLTHRADAFADADAGRYLPLVAEDYLGPEGGRAALLSRLATDLASTPRATLRPLAWQIRIERDRAQVGEDYEIALGGGVARRLRARLDLRADVGGWRFTGGL